MYTSSTVLNNIDLYILILSKTIKTNSLSDVQVLWMLNFAVYQLFLIYRPNSLGCLAPMSIYTILECWSFHYVFAFGALFLRINDVLLFVCLQKHLSIEHSNGVYDYGLSLSLRRWGIKKRLLWRLGNECFRSLFQQGFEVGLTFLLSTHSLPVL